MSRPLLYALLLFAASIPMAQGDTHCPATPISIAEARQLATSVPEAISIKRAGGAVTVISYMPPRHKDAFYYLVLMTTRTKQTLLNNGIIGYFSVNKVTGLVVNVADEDVVGEQLEKLQAELRAKRCISRALVVANQGVEP